MRCVVMWEYEVAEANRDAFARVYSPEGVFAALFAESADFLGTTLLANKERPGRYLTIDRWASREAYAAFKRDYAARYDALDDEHAGLSSTETYVGLFNEVGDG